MTLDPIMTIVLILIGVGLGFFVAACLMFWTIAISIKGSAASHKHLKAVNEQMVAQQKQIMFATSRMADALDKNAELFQKWMTPK